MQERRRFIRILEHAEISYKVVTNPRSEGFLTRDISQNGIRFYVHEFIPKGSLLKIKCTLSKVRFSFEAMVQIKWIKEQPRSERFEIGVEFVNIPKRATDYLIKYIDHIQRYK